MTSIKTVAQHINQRIKQAGITPNHNDPTEQLDDHDVQTTMVFSWQLLALSALVLLLCPAPAWPCSGSSSKGPKTFNHDINTQSGLTALFNHRVVKATRWERPLSGWPVKLGILKHSGVVVVLDDGRQYLIHKGSQYGTPKGGQTVVVEIRRKSPKWTEVRGSSKQVHISKVTDYVAAGGSIYKTLADNCHDAADRMMALP
ncbi:hypothetical protein LSAT2_013888 [Lamellibrachia satsuma]|nr:hypothetical protein LSAT2_013888 [Lamellibrachia satsuma]